MILKKYILLFLTALFLTQVNSAKQSINDSYMTMNHGIFHYSEITDLALTDVKINFIKGEINIVKQNTNGETNHNNMKFDPSQYQLPLNLKSTTFKSAQSNIEPIFNTNAELNQLYEKQGMSTKSTGCGTSAGKLLDLANRMIGEGEATGNDALVTYGRILRDIAIRMFQNCILQ